MIYFDLALRKMRTCDVVYMPQVLIKLCGVAWVVVGVVGGQLETGLSTASYTKEV